MTKEKTIIAINDLPSMTLAVKLSHIQVEFKAKKNAFNKFGGYNYRTAESILEALKPYNEHYQVYFTINETLINANPPIMSSVATIWDCESSQSIDCQAIVGVDLEQKGMAMPQRYGSTSSYAKKYALGNLLLIDDTADADATNKHDKPEPFKGVIEKIDMKYPSPEFDKAKDYVAGGGDITLIEKKYNLAEEIKNALLNTNK
jgi:hypothetical protein